MSEDSRFPQQYLPALQAEHRQWGRAQQLASYAEQLRSANTWRQNGEQSCSPEKQAEDKKCKCPVYEPSDDDPDPVLQGPDAEDGPFKDVMLGCKTDAPDAPPTARGTTLIMDEPDNRHCTQDTTVDCKKKVAAWWKAYDDAGPGCLSGAKTSLYKTARELAEHKSCEVPASALTDMINGPDPPDVADGDDGGGDGGGGGGYWVEKEDGTKEWVECTVDCKDGAAGAKGGNMMLLILIICILIILIVICIVCMFLRRKKSEPSGPGEEGDGEEEEEEGEDGEWEEG